MTPSSDTNAPVITFRIIFLHGVRQNTPIRSSHILPPGKESHAQECGLGQDSIRLRHGFACILRRMDDSAPQFIHLRIHSAYSLSEGALPIKQLAEKAKSHAMPALAITDTGNLFGALEFSETLAEKGIQPIIGCSLKLDFNDLPHDSRLPQKHQCAVLAFMAKDAKGYANLMKLSSR